tara:strand:+ start:366 stop:647 length:282 start_codon:yes stop_codon:yes gene_type:complete
MDELDLRLDEAFQIVLGGFYDEVWDFGDDSGYVDIYNLVTLHDNSQVIVFNDNLGFRYIVSEGKDIPEDIKLLNKSMEEVCYREAQMEAYHAN